MRTNSQNGELLAAKRRISLELVMLASDRSKHARLFSTLQAENRKLTLAKKNIIIDLERNTGLLRKEEAELRQIDADIATNKKRLNMIR